MDSVAGGNGQDIVSVATRSDGTTGNTLLVGNGVSFYWYDYTSAGPIGIQATGTATITNLVGGGSLNAIAGKAYNFEIVDQGTVGLSFTVTQADDPTNTATMTAKLGADTAFSLVTFRDYYNSYMTSYLDNVTISSLAVPSPRCWYCWLPA